MSHVVTAPLVIVRDEVGAQQYHYEGALLPSYVKAADLKRLVEEGLIAKVVETAAAAPSGPPARSGSREDWAAYALTLGATEKDLDGQTRDYIRDLVDLHSAASK